jgi:hypothetical protein
MSPALANREYRDMTQYGTWISYGGAARIGLAIVLLAAAGGLALAGTRLPLPWRAARPGRAATSLMLTAWVLAIAAFGVCVSFYAQHARQVYPIRVAVPADPITPVTFIAAGVTCLVSLIGSSDRPAVRLVSAAVAALAAPMIFELPFDLIVMTRTYPPIPPDPALYRVLFFLPLFLVEITTLSLLRLSPMVRLSRAAFWSLALMFAVFAAWSLFGFAFPGTPAPLALNVASKLLAFAAALSLFFPRPVSGRQDVDGPGHDEHGQQQRDRGLERHQHL